MGIFFNPRKWTIRLYFWLNDQKNCSLAFGCLPKSSVRFCFFVGNVTSLKMEAPLTVLLLYVTLLLLLSVQAGYFNGRPGLDKLAISSEIAPTRACSVIGNIDTLLQCFSGCMKRFRYFYMFGRSSVSLTCFCCKEPPGIPLPGTIFDTYITRE